jgi:hypothetical protein
MPMELIKLPPGEPAPDSSDYIAIVEEDGQFGFSGQILKIYGPMKQTVHLIGPEWYPSFDEALEAGIAWGRQHDANGLYIETQAN